MVALDASAQRVLDIVAKAQAGGTPSITDGTPEQARALNRRGKDLLSSPPLPVAAIEELQAAGPEAAIGLRLYRPPVPTAPAGAPTGPLPVTVFYHGGGWVLGDLDSHDVLCRALCRLGGFAVASVDYRLAPEHPFPAAVEDAFAALEWVVANAAWLDLDPRRVALAGDSAGGNLAAVVALLARDAGGPALRAQALLYPATDLAADSASHDLFQDHYLTREAYLWFLEHYLGRRGPRADWRASPLRAESHAGLPETFLLTAGYDPLRDEGIAYAGKLSAAGVAVMHRSYDGQLHGFLTLGKVIPEATPAIEEIAAALQRALA